MKYTLTGLLSVISLILMISCTKENNGEPGQNGGDGLVRVEIQASLEGIKTSWNEGDSISVSDGKKIYCFTATGSGPVTTFSGEVSASSTRLAAVYPYSADASVNPYNDRIVCQTILGRVQDKATDGSRLPMYAKFSQKNGDGSFKLNFKPCSAVIRFSIREQDAGMFKTITLKGNKGEDNLAGCFDVNLSSGNISGRPGMTYQDVAVSSGDGLLGAGAYFIGLGTLSGSASRSFAEGITLEAEADNGTVAIARIDGGISVPRGGVMDIGELDLSYHKTEGNVTGTVRFQDGKPASGVMVSDGFRIVTTDSEGKYKLGVSSDTWYIYLSLPADAKINTNASGEPDFYQRYESGKSVYDFTLTRQEVEEQFRIFALADMHGRKSWGWTDHVRELVVPAIRKIYAENSGLPCYGVTLGDLTHNTSSNNSNDDGSFEDMQSILTTSSVGFPVFQIIGNHDFTWFSSKAPLAADATSSTADLKWQRKFEGLFGPINYSFTRGKVHFVCLRNIHPASETDPDTYSAGYTDAQLSWLKQDLAHVSKDCKLIVCEHIPFLSRGGDNQDEVAALITDGFTDTEFFSAHKHINRFMVPAANLKDHSIVSPCGGVWSTDNFCEDGCPRGIRVFTFTGNRMTDDVFYGLPDKMDGRNYQMRIYRGGLKYGGSHAYFQTSESASSILINVFNAREGWNVDVYEDGAKTGSARLMDYTKRKTFSSVKEGSTNTVPAGMCQDWYVIGFNKGIRGKNLGKNDGYNSENRHMYIYTLKNAKASEIKVVATDPYGNRYECSDVMTDGTYYPSCCSYVSF